MDYRQINETVMNNTQELCANLNVLKSAIENSIQKAYVVYQDETITVNSAPANEHTTIVVSSKRTYEAAEKYKGKKICCLDFANNHSVGGAPWHAGAQEESLCRTSTLYPCLYAKRQEFYEKHIQEYETHKIDEMGNDDLIYIPDVVVFKTDESIPKLKPEDSWFKTDVIVCAAPQLQKNYDTDVFRKIMTSRIKKILDGAAKESVEVLILGAFGCGAFHNPPEIVSDIFATLIRNYTFETIEFAVSCRNDTKNFEIFKAKITGK